MMSIMNRFKTVRGHNVVSFIGEKTTTELYVRQEDLHTHVKLVVFHHTTLHKCISNFIDLPKEIVCHPVCS